MPCPTTPARRKPRRCATSGTSKRRSSCAWQRDKNVGMHIGLIGAGNISDTHARAASAIPGVTVSAVYARSGERADRLARQHGARAYSDFERFLDHRPMEIVAIGTPSGLHATHGIAAAGRGLHVLVEKPIDVTVARADALIDAARANGVKLGVFFQDRFAPGVRTLKTLIDEGRLGRP